MRWWRGSVARRPRHLKRATHAATSSQTRGDRLWPSGQPITPTTVVPPPTARGSPPRGGSLTAPIPVGLVLGEGPGGTFYQTFDVTLDGMANTVSSTSDDATAVLNQPGLRMKACICSLIASAYITAPLRFGCAMAARLQARR